MGNMRFKVGDRVRIKSLDWYNKNKTIHGDIWFDNVVFVGGQSLYCGCELTIRLVTNDSYYVIENDYYWTDEMIECKVEEENIDCEKCGLTRNSTRCLFMDNCPHNKQKTIIEIPEDWVLKDEHGNEILTRKIILEKKKKEYPKTYEECCEVLDIIDNRSVWHGYRSVQLKIFQKLLICRDVYWKIAGEEMGLGKPWEPDWTDLDQLKYCIWVDVGEFITMTNVRGQHILAFPTEEMRDAFYEAFREEIEICKELL